MSKSFSFPNVGTCSKQTNIVLNDDHTIESVEVIGGCNGNLKGISRLLKGMKAEDAIARMRYHLRPPPHQLPRPDRQEPEKGSGRDVIVLALNTVLCVCMVRCFLLGSASQSRFARQLSQRESQRIVLIQQPLKARPQLAPPSGELAKPTGFD